MKKRLLLLVAMLVPLIAMADESGKCGDNLTWTYTDATQTLTIEGSGAMTDYTSSSNVPWNSYMDVVDKIIIGPNVTTIGNYAFEELSKVTYVYIHGTVTSIGNRAFTHCTALTSIVIPNSVTSIGGGAFLRCSGLTSVIIGSSVTEMGFNPFSGCDNLSSVTFHCKTIDQWFSGFSSIKEIIIGENVLSIYALAFCGCTGLTSVTIDNGVTSIGNSAFANCSSLTSITLPNSVKSIGSFAFDGCNALSSITIPNSVTSIGDGAFRQCTGLTSITIPNSVTSIGDNPFFNCAGLISMNVDSGNTKYDSRDNCNAIIETKSNTLIAGCKNTATPNSVTSIGPQAFRGSSSLTSITIPNSVRSIGDGAFAGCIGLTLISIGRGVTSIAKSAFSSCNNMQDFYLYAEQPPTTNADVFSDANTANATLHVYENMLYVYQSITPWKDFGTIVAIDGEPVVPVVPEPQKCEKPTISYVNGKLTFSCATDGATCHYSITDSDIKSGSGDELQLTATYNISVYATKAGYDNSDVATATLCWIDVEPKTEGISNGIAQVPAKAVLIQAAGGSIKVQGCDDGEHIGVYSINGSQVGTAVSQNGAATVNTTLQPGRVAIIKVGKKSIKVMIK